ncbi:MAG: hypothetical protein ACTHMS_05285 [Jatrophihabitans sp.]|uniref:hypothetical protein n=1 Tax=Jatrophihabitans sp. TaxID=1932789 RepID=UPI003F7CD4B3
MIIDETLRCLDCGSNRVRTGTGPVACPPELARARRKPEGRAGYSDPAWMLRALNAVEAAVATGVPFQFGDLDVEPNPSQHGVFMNVLHSSKALQYAGATPDGRKGRRGEVQLWKASPDFVIAIARVRAHIRKTTEQDQFQAPTEHAQPQF